LGFKLTEQITELFEYFARLFFIVLPCIACIALKTLPFQISCV